MKEKVEINNQEKAYKKDEYIDSIYDLIYLLICAVNKEYPDIKRIERMDLNLVYDLASYHSVVSLVAFVLEQVIELPHKFDQDKKKAIRKLALYDIERTKIFASFNQEKIWFAPLKGIVLKDYYPKSCMREMADNDILCDATRVDDVRSIMEENGYACEQFGLTHDVYTKHILSFECHRTLFSKKEYKHFYNYFKTIKKRLIRQNSSYQYRFKPEDFYVYIVAHEYKHYYNGGTGLRSLLDNYVYLKHQSEQLDWHYISQELSELSLSKFEKMHRELSEKVFSRASLTDEDKHHLLYYISSGANGTEEHLWRNIFSPILSRDDSFFAKNKYLINRIVLNGEMLKNQYPFVYRHRLFIPCLFVFRITKAIFIKPKKIMTEFKYLIKYKNAE